MRLRTDLHEEGSDDLLVELKKHIGHQWGMGIGKRPRGILVTSLQPGSTAAEKLVVGDRIMAVNGEPISDQASTERRCGLCDFRDLKSCPLKALIEIWFSKEYPFATLT